MINRKFWTPSITSQYRICPIPFHLDTYRGCVHNCSYCFARDFTTFSRRNSEHKGFAYLEGNRPDLFESWVERTMKDEYNYLKAEKVALKERIPLKVGANSDPFPPVEKEEGITLGFLKVLEKYDYPVEIQTKNPNGLVEIMEQFKNPNWTISVTVISTDPEFVKVCEPNAPTTQQRLEAIKKLTDYGLKVMVKIQPAIYPKILTDLPDLIKAIKESGCWAFNTEGLKIRISMPENEQKIMQTIGDYLGINIREHYKVNGQKTGSDWEMTNEKKMEYVRLAERLARQYDLKYFVADNHMGKIGCGCECCGTQVLRDYKIWGNNERTKYFDTPDYCSKELGKCLVNFCRSKKWENKTIDEVMAIENGQQVLLHNSFQGGTRVYDNVSPTISTPSGGGHLPYVAMGWSKSHRTGSTEADKRRHNFGEIEQRVKIGEFNSLSCGDGCGNQSTKNYVAMPKKEKMKIRKLTPKECERLQGFPDDWTKHGIDEKGNQVEMSDTQRYKMCGNALTVNVAREIIQRLFNL